MNLDLREVSIVVWLMPQSTSGADCRFNYTPKFYKTQQWQMITSIFEDDVYKVAEYAPKKYKWC